LLPRHALIPLIVACALFMENLDSTVLSTALPAIAASFGEDPVRLNLAITAYLFSLAVFIPISGWVADRFGARRVFRAAILVFTVGSILCGISQSLTELVLARIFQGLGGAMMVPVGRLVLLRSVDKAQLVSAMTYLTVPALIGPVIGPPLGGFITTYFSWRWIFFINVPIGLLGMLLATLFIEEIREERPPPLDLPGFLLTGIGLMSIVVAFESIGRPLLPAGAVLALFAIGAAALLTYLHHYRRQTHPALNLGLLRVPTFRVAIVGGFLFRIGIGATPFLLPLMLQIGFGMSPLKSGLLTFAGAAGRC
jgi:EmrB/QacA subfamily drug resistance transporter